MTPTACVQSRPLQAMHPNCHPALRALRVQATDDEIVISGRVSSFYLKQLAQETLMPERGQRGLVNRVSVVRE